MEDLRDVDMKPKVAIALLVLGLGAGEHTFAQNRVWHESNGFRWADFQLPSQGRAGFVALSSAQTQITFTNWLSESSIASNRVLANGSGVAVGDYDNDGLPDIYFCGLESPNVLYRNLGNWKFKDVTAESGVAFEPTYCRGAVFADVNGDGHLDLLVSTFNQGIRCFINDGHGKFSDATARAGIRSSFGTMTMALADIDGNGTLDLYVANNRPNDIRDRGQLSLPAVNGKPVIPAQFKDRLVFRNGQLQEYGQPDQLFLNNGSGQFKEVSWFDGTFVDEAGQKLTRAPLDWGLSATFRDINGDLAPDLYVCNDYWTFDRVWMNDGHGHFRAIENIALRKISSSSMGVDFADIDRDGLLDFFVVDMLSRDARLRKRQSFAEKPAASPIGVNDLRAQVMRNTLFKNRGDGTYAEMANYSGLAASDWSWSPIFLDVDLDGYDDLLISAGHFRDVQDMDAEREIQARQHSWKGYKDEAERQKAFTKELQEHYKFYPTLNMPVVAFRNAGNWEFQEMTDKWGFNRLGVHHGMALGDFDGDGDLDLVVNVLNGPAGIYRNESIAPRVAIKLKGLPPNTQGIGAKVSLLNGAVPKQTTEMISGGRYLSGCEVVAVFAAGSTKSNLAIEVAWRNGKTSRVSEVQPNRVYEIDEPAGPGSRSQGAGIRGQASPTNSQLSTLYPLSRRSGAKADQPFFKDASGLLSHTHHETEFNDYARQPLLPFKLSQSGPGVAWFDLDGDGHDDLIIGSGSGGAPAVFRANGRSGFARTEAAVALAPPSDLSGLVGWTDGTGQRAFIAGIAGYEAPSTFAATEFRLADGRLAKGDSVAPEMTSGGALALGDMNGDGHLVLFVAGGVAPGKYPMGAPSKLYRRTGNQWQLDSRNSVLFDNLGIVNAAVWSDLTGDGIPELILACEWGPIRIFRNRGGLLFEATQEFGLNSYTGWWKGITTGDFDGDGRMDIVAANWGLNSPYQASEQKPLVFFYGQLAEPGRMDVVATEYDSTSGALTPRRQLLALANSLPFLFDQFVSHKAYSEATLDQVLGQRRALGRRVEANTLASMVFLNRGERFEAVPLPREAQLAPAFSVNVADFNGDGSEDVFISQNFSAMQAEVPALDSGRGLWLQGNGKGQLLPVPSDESGIAIYGDQRGAALCDFNEDGRVDLVVTQNGGATKLYKNERATVGLRVKLQGPSGNPNGIGAVMRLQFNDHQGPAREVHAGSGYWSQDSSIQVLHGGTKPDSIWIRWPGGRTTTTAIRSDAAEVTIASDGKLVSSR